VALETIQCEQVEDEGEFTCALRSPNWTAIESSAPIPGLGGAESDEGITAFGRPVGVLSCVENGRRY
jgi:hypothetical protein